MNRRVGAIEIVCIESDYRYADWRTKEREYIEPGLPPHGYGQRGGYAIPRKVTDRNGKPRCRWCLGPLSGRRRSWCSQKCVDEALLRRDWNVICRAIRERDKLCVLCGGGSWKHNCWARYGRSDCPVPKVEDVENGRVHRHCRITPYFEVDHIVAVNEGGTDDPENLRLLCRECHKRVTAEQRARWAAEGRPQLELEIV